jgi:GNAT superfamily N-acetyltransferase
LPPTVRTFAPHEWRTYRDLRLRALQESPDAFGSTYAWEVVHSDERWAERLGRADPRWNLPLVAELDGTPIGLTWGRIQEVEPTVVHVYQVWVAPEHRGLGAGRLLIEAVIEWAKRSNIETVILNVTCGDTPARRLYERVGFEAFGDPIPLREGSAILEQGMRLTLGTTRA